MSKFGRRETVPDISRLPWRATRGFFNSAQWRIGTALAWLCIGASAAHAQQATCNDVNGTYNCTTSGNSTTNGFYATQTGSPNALLMLVTSAGSVSFNAGNDAGDGLNFTSYGQAGAGGNAQGLTLSNSGSIDLSTGPSTGSIAANGIVAVESAGIGNPGGNTTNGVTVYNDGNITLSLATVQATGHDVDGILAQDSGGVGNSGYPSGSSAAAVVENAGTISIAAEGNAGVAGIQAQSISPNGGNGSPQGDFGGDGGYTGDGGSARVISEAPVNVAWNWNDTDGSNGGVYGIVAQSSSGQAGSGYTGHLAGYGGAGGTSIVTLLAGGNVNLVQTGTAPSNAPPSPSAGVTAAVIGGVGGDAGYGDHIDGGNGGAMAGNAVIVDTDANVSASGNQLPAILAYGLGGTAGNGNLDGFQNGGAGGNAAGNAMVTVNAQTQTVTLSTLGGSSPAVAAILQGGAGGIGGSQSRANANSGAGGNSGNVTGQVQVNLIGGPMAIDVATNGGSSPGIYAESTGVTGGAAGNSQSAIGNTSAFAGGNGGNGGNVTVNLVSTAIVTQGTNSPGIVAPSQGGNGGLGGYGGGGIGSANGGNGGNGGDTGNVAVSLDGASSITTQGSDSMGVLGQTIAGAGGNAAGRNGAFGGSSGNGGSGGGAHNVSVTNAGKISTGGASARGILVQSLTGAGGTGGTSWGLAASGGTGGNAGTVGAVFVTNSGTITTTGAQAEGVVAQSIGGSGGAGGNATSLFSSTGGLGGDADTNPFYASAYTVNFTQNGGSIATSGISAIGVMLQSIGGGGGDGGNGGSLAATFGGNGGAGGDGSQVTATLNNGSQISTSGFQATGIELQSIGGGGGNGGSASSNGLFASVSLGGQGKEGGNASTALLTATGATITTVGNKSPGLVVQSIGGGGGSGGAAFAGSVGAGFAASVAVGGNGGGGGNGALAQAAFSGGLIATGQNPFLVLGGTLDASTGKCTATTGAAFACNLMPVDDYGAVVQSIGGGGGLGGSATAQSIAIAIPTPVEGAQAGMAISVGLGGNGGTGGPGGEADFALSKGGMIITNGDGSTAVLAQSIGGGGGAGGDSSTLSEVIGYGSESSEGTPASLGVAATFAEGGKGGSGDTAGDVNVAIGGSVTSNGNSAATLTADPAGSAPTAIVTYNDFADGIKAQSIGGGGGDAGFGSGNTQGFGTSTTASISVTLGSDGGTGGTAGNTTVNLYSGSGIQTLGSDAIGLVAQSIGGGGGASQGGSIDPGLEVAIGSGKDSREYKAGLDINLGSGLLGATAANGGAAGNASVLVDADINTRGGDADGVLVQSIGGGGGIGGSAGSDASADNPVITALEGQETLANALHVYLDTGKVPVVLTATMSFGGIGGSGNTGGTATAQVDAHVQTSGDWAPGVEVQSIGGGGGAGGTAVAKGTGGVPGSSFLVNADVSVGGAGGTGGNGGTATVNFGDGASVSTGGAQNSVTQGFASPGVVVQSIGGGGGAGGDGSDAAAGNISVGTSNGGTGGGGANGGAANFYYTTNASGSYISTAGVQADGVFVQSIGGGGGIAGSGSSDFLPSWTLSEPVFLNAGDGQAGGYGSGGAVTFGTPANMTAVEQLKISTSGWGAFGIVAQSVGGSGGLITAMPSSSSITPSFGTLGSGFGGAVSVTLDYGAYVNTTGAGAVGIVAQSVGGGGGIIRYGNVQDNAISLSTSTLPSGLKPATAASNSNGGDVTVLLNSNVTTSGQGAIGLIAQSVGGGGGLLAGENSWYAGAPGLSNGYNICGTNPGCSVGGVVKVTMYGSVVATGAGSTGIFAQSTGFGPSTGQVGIALLNGQTVEGGSTAIWIDTPASSPLGFVTLTDGNLTTVQGATGTAVTITGGGKTQLENNCAGNACGTVTGNVNLNGGTFYNNGNYVAGPNVTANLVNAGLVDLSALGQTGQFITRVTGDYTQSASGRLQVLVDSLNHTASMLSIDGTAEIGGSIIPDAVSLLPGSLQVVSATALSSTAKGQGSLLYDWLTRQTGNSVFLTPSAKFTSSGTRLSASEASLAQFMQTAWNNSDPLFAAQFAGFSKLSSSAAFRSTLDAYSGKATEAQSLAYINNAGAILGAAMSCPAFADQSLQLGENDCVWMKVTAQQSNQWENGDTQGYRVGSVTTRIGGQHEFAPDWTLGGALAVGTSSASADATANNPSSGTGQSYDGSLAIKHWKGTWLFAGSLAIADGEYHSDRAITLPNSNVATRGDPSVFMTGARLRVGREFAFNNFYLLPYGDADLLYTDLRAFRETGPAPYALIVQGGSKATITFSPMLEAGGRVVLNDKLSLRPFGDLGASFTPDNNRSIHADFNGALASDGLFSSQLDSPLATADLGVGAELYHTGGLRLRAEYDAMISGTFMSQGASAKFSYAF